MSQHTPLPFSFHPRPDRDCDAPPVALPKGHLVLVRCRDDREQSMLADWLRENGIRALPVTV